MIFVTSGPDGLHKIASRIHSLAAATYYVLAAEADLTLSKGAFFDTFTIDVSKISKTSSKSHQTILSLVINSLLIINFQWRVSPAPALSFQSHAANSFHVNVRVVDQNSVGLSFGEAINKEDITALLSAFGVKNAEEKFTTSNLLSIEIYISQ